MRRVLILSVMLLFGLASNAQLLEEAALDTVRTFFSIESAMKKPDKVYKLKLRKQKLTEIPADVFKLKNLNELDLGKNKIKVLPSDIGKLKYLQTLDVGKNKIDSLPPAIGELTNLKVLVINQNEIYQIPVEIGKLTKLEFLDAWSNNFEEFPQELKNLKNLKKMDLRAIMIDTEIQKYLKKLLPETKIYFDKGCDCGMN